MQFLSTILFFALTQGIEAVSHRQRSPFLLKERHDVPHGWLRDGPASKSNFIELQVGLKQRIENAVERHLEEISDPKHLRYGQHLSASDVRELAAPAEDTLKLVREWLRDHGVSDEEHEFSVAKDWVTVSVPISTLR